MNKHLFGVIFYAIAAFLIFLWDSYKIKHGKYDMPTYKDRLFTGAWRWVYNWGWMTIGMLVVEFGNLIESI